MNTIIIPTYNQKQAYLDAAVQSALLQDTRVEVKVVDDGSREHQEPSPHTLKYLGNKHSTIQIRRYENNKGVAGALNHALETASGEYIHWLSSDDLYARKRCSVMSERMKEQDAKVAYCAWEDGIPIAQRIWPSAQYSSKHILLDHLQRHSFINACAVCWHRSVFDEIGLFDPEFTHTQTLSLFYDALRNISFWL